MRDILGLIEVASATNRLAKSPSDSLSRRAEDAAAALMARAWPTTPIPEDGKYWAIAGWTKAGGNVAFPFTGGDRDSLAKACRDAARWCVEAPNRYAALRAFAHDPRCSDVDRTEKAARGVTCYGFDVDVGGKAEGHKNGKTIPTDEGAVAFVEELRRDFLPPSLVMDTGGGVQFFYNLDTCVDGESYAHAHALANRLFEGVQRLAQKHGAKGIDGTFDGARVLRLPGCWREKGKGRDGEVVGESSGATYSIAELERLAQRLEELPDVEPGALAFDASVDAGGTTAGGAVNAKPRTTARRASPAKARTEGEIARHAARSRATDQIVRRMASLAASTFEQIEVAGGVSAYVLDVCPACGGRQSDGKTARGTAHLTYVGRLKCKRGSCPADEGHGGLALEAWILAHARGEAQKDLAGLALELQSALDAADASRELEAAGAPKLDGWKRTTPGVDAAQVDTLSAAQKAAAQAIVVALNLDPTKPMPGVGVVKVPTGVGKTAAAVRLAIDGAIEPGKLCLAFQTHDLLRQAIKDLERAQVPVVVLEGIGTACKFKERWRELGQPADWRRRVCVDCPVRSTCGAMRKPKAGHLLACVVAHLPHLVDDDGDDDPSPLRGRRLIIDEAPAAVDVVEHDGSALARTERNAARFGPVAESARVGLRFLRGVVDGCIAASRATKVEDRRHGVPVHGMALDEVVARVVVSMDAEVAEAAAKAPAGEARQAFDRNVVSMDSDDPLGFLPRLGGLGEETKIEAPDAPPTTLRDALAPVLNSSGGMAGALSARRLRADLGDGGYAVEDLPHPDFLRVLRAVLGVPARCADKRATPTVEVVVRDDADGGVRAWFELRRPLDLARIRQAVEGLAILDATADQSIDELHALARGIPVEVVPVEFAVPYPRRFWRKRTDATRRKLCARAADDLTVDAWSIIRTTVREALDAFGGVRTGERLALGLLSFQQVAKAIERAQAVGVLRERLALPDGVDLVLGYFGRDDRGSRRFEAVDGMIVLGTPKPNLRACQSDARCMGLDAQGGDRLIASRTMRSVVQALGRAREARRDVPILYVGEVLPANWEPETVQVVAAVNGSPVGSARQAVEDVVLALVTGGWGATPETVGDWLADLISQPLIRTLYRGSEIYSAEVLRRSFDRVARDLQAVGSVQFVSVPVGRGRPRRVLVAPGLSPDHAEHVARRALYMGAEAVRRDPVVEVPEGVPGIALQSPMQPVAGESDRPLEAGKGDPKPVELVVAVPVAPSVVVYQDAPGALPFGSPARFVDPGDQGRRRKAVALAWSPPRPAVPIVQSRPAIVTRRIGGAA